MKPAPLVLLVVVVLMAAVVSCLSIFVYTRTQPKASCCEDAHDLIHNQLQLTAEQEKAIEPIEQRYHEQRRDLEAQMSAGNKELAAAILADGKDSPRVREAIAKIHLAMGELQNATLDHVFAMKASLTPEQYDKLLHLTADTLGKLDDEHARK